jgi:DnaJ-class molecular chaperone
MGWGGSRNADKRGNTSGGSSTGRSGQKRGGREKTGDPADSVDRGTLTCPKCLGSGQIGNPAAEQDAGEPFDGASQITCTRCNGTGQVKAK